MRGIAAKVGIGSSHLVNIHSVHHILIGQPFHNSGKLAPPYGTLRAHDRKFCQPPVRLMRSVAFGIGAAVLCLCRRGRGVGCIAPDIPPAIVRIPQAAVDIGHDMHLMAVQCLHAFAQPLLHGKIMGKIVVEGNPVPVVQVVSNGHAQRIRKLDGLAHPGIPRRLLGRPDADGYGIGIGVVIGHPVHNVQRHVAHPCRRIGPSMRRKPGSRLHKGAVDLRHIVPIALKTLPYQAACQRKRGCGNPHVNGGKLKLKRPLPIGEALHAHLFPHGLTVVNRHVQSVSLRFAVRSENGHRELKAARIRSGSGVSFFTGL